MSTPKRLLLALTVLCLLAVSCEIPVGGAPAATALPATSVAVSTATQTPRPIPTLTLTQPPTAVPATPTLTPLPAIPSFTPTFDARTIVTVTPAPKAECPEITPVTNPDLEFLDFSFDKPENQRDAEQNILNFLNSFGPTPLYKKLKQSWSTKNYTFQDLTGDGLPELSVRAFSFYIFGCHSGQYKNLFELEPDGYLQAPSITTLKDVNHNGIPELTILLGYMSQGGHSYAVYEWNGETFANLIPSGDPDMGEIWVEATGEIHYEDVDRDSVQELILDSGIPVWETYYSGLPWRNQRTTYKWNGQNYIPAKNEFAQPEFRFQAAQDGDLAVKQDEFDKAFDLYQQTIFSDKLREYSPEIHKNLQEIWQEHFTNDKPSPTPPPNDPTEYPQLAAYAYYRMIILHTHLGELDAATIQYTTLQEKFPAASPGQPYAEMASAFWDAYQTSQNMTNACGAAIAYAAAHPDILTVLGSDYHGWQSHTYVPADVCPFR